MVFSEVEIWCGVVLTKEQVMDLVDSLSDEKLDRSDEDATNLYELITLLNDNVDGAKSGYNDDPTIPQFIKMSPCCGESEMVLFGVKLVAYERSKFNVDDVAPENKEAVEAIHIEKNNFRCGGKHCGKMLETDGNLKDRCGYYSCCDECLNSTINGAYPVEKILNHPTECTSYCFQCNEDRCPERHARTPGLSAQPFIDKVIREALSNVEVPEEQIQIKNYYILDDCLSCT